MSIFVSLSSSSGLSDITAVSMSSPQRLRSGVSILRLCPTAHLLPWHNPWSRQCVGAYLPRCQCCRGIARNKWWGLEGSVCCFGFLMHADKARVQQRALLCKSSWRIDVVSSWCCMHWKMLALQTAGTQTCWSASETKGNCQESLLSQ